MENSKLEDTNFSDNHLQVNNVTNSQNLINKNVQLLSWNLFKLIDTLDRKQY